MAQEQEFDWTVAAAERAAAYLKQLDVPTNTEPPSLLTTHLKLDEKVDAVSAEVSAELGEIVHNIDGALRSTGNFSLSLDALMPLLGGALSARDLKMVVEALADATKHVAEHSRALERRITHIEALDPGPASRP